MQWLRVAGVKKVLDKECYHWKAKGQCSRGDKCSFRHDGDERAKPTPKTAPPSEPPTQRGRRASRKKNLRGRSPSGKFARQPCRDYLKGVCTTSPCDKWHPPERQFYKSESGCRFGDKCSFAQRHVEGKPSKKPKKDCDNYIERFTAVVLISGHRAAGIFIDYTEEDKSLWTNSTSTIHKSYAASSKHPRKQRSVARKIQS